jgi:hypothetical protein
MTLTKEQEKRFDEKFPQFNGVGAPFPIFSKTPNVTQIKQHMAEEIERAVKEVDDSYDDVWDAGYAAGLEDPCHDKRVEVSVEAERERIKGLIEELTVGLPDPNSGFWDVVDAEDLYDALTPKKEEA